MKDQGTIIAAEIEQENYLDLVRNVVLNKVQSIFPLHVGFSDKDEFSKLYLAVSPRSHTLEATNPANTALRNEVRLTKTITWDTLIDLFALNRVDYCKCNIEGAEVRMLKGMTKVLPQEIALQCHTESLLNETIKLLKEKGYQDIRVEWIDWVLARLKKLENNREENYKCCLL